MTPPKLIEAGCRCHPSRKRPRAFHGINWLWLAPLVMILSSCTKSYEHTLILDNNSLVNVQVISYSSNPDFADTVSVGFGAEAALFHSQAEEYAGLSCLDNIDSIKVIPGRGQFIGDIMDSDAWTMETLDRSYKQLTFCTFEFTRENLR